MNRQVQSILLSSMVNISCSRLLHPFLNTHTHTHTCTVHTNDSLLLRLLLCFHAALTVLRKPISEQVVFKHKCNLSLVMARELRTWFVHHPHVHTVACANLHMRLVKAAWPLTKGMMGGGSMWCGRWSSKIRVNFLRGLSELFDWRVSSERPSVVRI